jgi:sulfur carrier protein
MQIQVNGEPREIGEGTTLTQLLDTLDLRGRRCAIEVNQALVPRSEQADRVLRADDRVEIVQAIGGG